MHSITTGSSMQAMIRTAPSRHTGRQDLTGACVKTGINRHPVMSADSSRILQAQAVSQRFPDFGAWPLTCLASVH
jgi:hypothetical protein